MRASPSETAWLRVAGLVVGLAHPREHEHLVVHREAEQEGEDHQRDPGDDRLCRLHVPDRLRAVSLLEDEDDDPVGGAERDEVEDRGLQRQHERAEGAREQDQREQEHEAEHVGEVRVDGADEVAFLGRRPRRARASPRCPGGAASVCWSAGSTVFLRSEMIGRTALEEPSTSGNASTRRGVLGAPGDRRGGARDPRGRLERGHDLRRERPGAAGSPAPAWASTTNGFITPGGDPGGGERVTALDRLAAAREVLDLRLARVQLQPGVDEQPDDDQPDRGDRQRPPHHERGPAPPPAVFGVAGVDEPPREHAVAVDAGAEGGEQRRQQRDRRDHRDGRDQHPADPDRADERQRQHDHREEADGDRRARDDHRAPGVGHRLRRARSRRPRLPAARRGSGR